MLTSKEIRQIFLDFFKDKGHRIVPSAPIVVKNDPTLMFTNAGMNQFKDLFLGNKKAEYTRVADTQKCLRVSGKHNDLEEVGVDHYHHTMFEMLGNWSFGDYFKKEAIAWSWELLTDKLGIDKSRLYVTVFEGDAKENLAFDHDSYDFWKQHIAEDRILKGNKKDNFWEMGDTGPCGPCTEIHVDTRTDEERAKVDGKTLVNNDHADVIEIWNNVFMEFNRKADGSLEKLPAQHVDTGMGFERLTRVIQGRQSNYDSDIFTGTISTIETLSGKKYNGSAEKSDIAFRVIADHIRAISFTIADGQLPSNTGAGYVIRRILRRAVRYGYSFLGMKEPFLCRLVPVLAEQFRDVFPELYAQKDFVSRVVQEEENAFLKTLSNGLEIISNYLKNNTGGTVDGKTAFELYDTFGFPKDLTQLIASENNATVDLEGFETYLNEQKARSRADAKKETGDWQYLTDDEKEEFIGYDFKEATVNIARYRTVKVKDKEQYQLVFNITPFYAESGGQIGDTGTLTGLSDNEVIQVLDTQKENDLIIHYTNKLPQNLSQPFAAKIDSDKQKLTANNHSATHLLQAALKQVLGNHVAQKGSLVTPDYLRFDFTHFAKMSEEEIAQVEQIVNARIRENIVLNEQRHVPLQQAIDSGATALFGEKYGDEVRVITFDRNYSVELCGGIHVPQTSVIGNFKIIAESSVAAGVRRIEAITSVKADNWINERLAALHKVSSLLNNPKDIEAAVTKLNEENSELKKKLEAFETEKAMAEKQNLKGKIQKVNDYHILTERLDGVNADNLKTICFQLRNEVPMLFGVITSVLNDKPMVTVFAGDDLVAAKGINCSNIVRELAKEIQGGGGGQAFYATAGGKDISGLDKVIEKAKQLF